MRFLFPLDLVLRGQRPVRDFEIDHLVDRLQALETEWPRRVRVQSRSETLTLAIAGLGPVFGYFVFDMPALELFLLLALDAFVLLLGDWLKYLVAPYPTQLAVARCYEAFWEFHTMARYLESGGDRSFRTYDHDRLPRELLMTAIAGGPSIAGIPLAVGGMLAMMVLWHQLDAAFWTLAVGVGVLHLVQSVVAGFQARDDDRLAPKLLPQAVDLMLLVSVASLIAFGLAWFAESYLILTQDDHATLFFVTLAGVTAVVVAIWRIRLRRQLAVLDQFAAAVRG
ncbi:MAG: hypothetical protein R3200_05945 [Xanthomonadales bacterium]|nr:hypothetical protein [Xanthomonadales bacterium]